MWFILAILSVISLAIAELTQQYLLNKKEQSFSPRSSAVITFLIQAIFTIPIIFLLPIKSEYLKVLNLNLIFQILLVTIIASVGMVFYLRSFQVKNISISTIFVSSSVIVSTILGIIFFNESTTVYKYLGITLVLTAIILLNYKNSILEKNHLYGIFAGLLFGICYTIDKSIVTVINPIIYISISFFLVAFWGFILKPKEVILDLKNKSLAAYKPLFISAVGYLTFNILTFTSYRFGGEVGKVDTINNTQVFLIILFEYFILSHKTHVFKKIAATILAFIGISLLGLFN